MLQMSLTGLAYLKSVICSRGRKSGVLA